jgi:hypothetical protein
MRLGRAITKGNHPMRRLTSGADEFRAAHWVAELFRQLGYKVEQNVFVGGIELDLVIEHDGMRSPVDVIFPNNPVNLSRIVEKAARLAPIAHTQGYVSPIIAVLAPVTAQAKKFAGESHHARIWDISALREKAESFPELRQKLAALTGESEADAVATQRDKGEQCAEAMLIERLEKHQKYGDLSFTEYELLCQEVMTLLFDPHLYGFERQAKTSDGANLRLHLPDQTGRSLLGLFAWRF